MQFSASPICTIDSMAASFGTGSAPGRPRHTGHTFVFGGDPNALRHPQNIFVAVESSTWHSRPITVSYAVTTTAYRGEPTRFSRLGHPPRWYGGDERTNRAPADRDASARRS